jgi:hypothetical protein
VPFGLAALVALAGWGALSWDVSRRLTETRVVIFPPGRARGPLWHVRRGPLLAFRHLALGPPICGVGLLGVAWWETGGASWLSQDAPIYEKPLPPLVDVVVANRPFREAGWTRDRCFDEACIYRRRGRRCTPRPDLELNQILRARGE